MVGGFATVAGGVMAAYVRFGIDAGHLLTASVISAPAALMIAKIIYPEIDEPPRWAWRRRGRANDCQRDRRRRRRRGRRTQTRPERGRDAHRLPRPHRRDRRGNRMVRHLVRLRRPTALVALIDTRPDLFWPLAWLMGIERADCFHAGELLGLKMAANEFVAYSRLSTWDPTRLRSPAQRPLGADPHLRALRVRQFQQHRHPTRRHRRHRPQRRSDLARLGLKAMLGGTLAAFMTACIAGMLI